MKWDEILGICCLVVFIGLGIKSFSVISSLQRENGRYEKRIQFLYRIAVLSISKCLAFGLYFNTSIKSVYFISSISSLLLPLVFLTPIKLFCNLISAGGKSNTSIIGIQFISIAALIFYGIQTFIAFTYKDDSKLKYLDIPISLLYAAFAFIYAFYGVAISNKLESMDENDEKVKFLKQRICSQLISTCGLMTIRAIMGVMGMIGYSHLNIKSTLFLDNLIEAIMIILSLTEPQTKKKSLTESNVPDYELRKVLIDH